MAEWIDFLSEVLDELPNAIQKVKSIQKTLFELELQAREQQTLRARASENAATHNINTPPETAGDIPPVKSPPTKKDTEVIECELDSTGSFVPIKKKLEVKK